MNWKWITALVIGWCFLAWEIYGISTQLSAVLQALARIYEKLEEIEGVVTPETSWQDDDC